MDADYHENELRRTLTEASIRMNWEKSLNEVTHGEALSGSIDFGFSEQDITILAGLHMTGDKAIRTKIEDLLTDCNFHKECRNFMNGDYDIYIPDPNYTALRKTIPDSFEEIKASAPEMIGKWNKECALYNTLTDGEKQKYSEYFSDFQNALFKNEDIHKFLKEAAYSHLEFRVNDIDTIDDNDEPQF